MVLVGEERTNERTNRSRCGKRRLYIVYTMMRASACNVRHVCTPWNSASTSKLASGRSKCQMSSGTYGRPMVFCQTVSGTNLAFARRTCALSFTVIGNCQTFLALPWHVCDRFWHIWHASGDCQMASGICQMWTWLTKAREHFWGARCSLCTLMHAHMQLIDSGALLL